MSISLEKIEGRKFCVVFVKVLDEATGKVQLLSLRGRASVEHGKVTCISDDGTNFTIPSVSVANILPSDGTPYLKDAEFFCFVKVDKDIQLANKEIDF